MIAIKAIFSLTMIYCCQSIIVSSASVPVGAQYNGDELNTCEDQLSKYRKFILQAIINFEDVCDAYTSHVQIPSDGSYNVKDPELFRNYQPNEQRSEIWAFFKLLMAQFNDMEFINVIREAVVERCRVKSQLQRDEKRNSVVLGKKQRFHSWGGKRSQNSPLQNMLISPSGVGQSSIEDHNSEGLYFTQRQK